MEKTNIAKIKTFIILLTFLLSIGAGLCENEINILIDMDERFYIDEVISFNYTIISAEGAELIYYPYVKCFNAPYPLIEEKSSSLNANVSYKEEYTYIKITKDIEPQTCEAYIEILEPYRQKVSKNFSIIANPSFSFNIQLNKKIFLLNEEILLDYDSDVENPVINAVLTYPDKTTQEITLPITIKASQIGTHELYVDASKEGYKIATKKEQFAVIEKHAEINTLGIGKATEEEAKTPEISERNLPISSSEEKSKNNLILIFFIFIIVALIVFVIITLYSLLKTKNKKGKSL